MTISPVSALNCSGRFRVSHSAPSSMPDLEVTHAWLHRRPCDLIQDVDSFTVNVVCTRRRSRLVSTDGPGARDRRRGGAQPAGPGTLRDLAPDLVLSAGDLPWDYLEYVASGGRRADGVRARQPRPGDRARPRASRNGTYTAGGHAVRRPAPARRDQRRPAGRRGRRPPHRRARRLRALQAGPAPVHPAPVRPAGRDRLLRRAKPGGPSTCCSPTRHRWASVTARTGRTSGIEALHRVLERLEPTWHLHGHIHPYGQTMPDRQVGPTTIRNVIPWKVIDITPRSPTVATSPATKRENGAMVRDTGSPRADAESDFLRARRHQTLSSLAGWLRSDAGRPSPRRCRSARSSTRWGAGASARLGVQVIPLDQIVGSVDKVQRLRPSLPAHLGPQPAALGALAQKSRTGRVFPPIDVYKLGNLYFVRDGHHRVSVARAPGRHLDRGRRHRDRHGHLDTEGIGGRRDLDGKNWGLRFLKRVPLTGERRAEINCTDPDGLPPARRDGRGLGVPADARRRAPTSTRRRWPALVRRGVHPGRSR